MAFNPDAFIAKNKSFNPDAFIAKNKPQPKVETIPTKQETVTLPPPQRSVMSAIINPKVQVQEPETELTDFKAIEQKILDEGEDQLTPDEELIYLKNRPKLSNEQPYYPDEINQPPYTAQPDNKETIVLNKQMPNPMLPMGGGAFAVKPREAVTQEQQPQISWLDDLKVLGSETLKGIKGSSYSISSGAVNNSYLMGKMSLGAVPGTAMPMIPNLETRNKVEQGYKNAPSSPLARELYDKSKQYAQTEGTGWKGFVGQAVGNAIPYMAASIVGGLVNPAAPFMVGFAVEDNEAYFEAIDNGASEEEARLNQVVVGLINAAIEQLQVGQIFKFAKGGKQVTKELVDAAKDRAFAKLAKAGGKLSLDIIKNATTEGLEEALQETSSVVMANRVGADISGKEAVERIGGSALGGAVVGGLMGAGGRIISNSGSDFSGEPVRSSQQPQPIPPDKVFGKGLGIGEKQAPQSTPAVQTPEVKGNEVGIQNNAAQGNVDGSETNIDETQKQLPDQGDMSEKVDSADMNQISQVGKKVDETTQSATISTVQENEVARDNIAPQDTTEAGKGKIRAVKDAETGKPITFKVYHGTPDGRFLPEFDPDKKGYFKNAPDALPWNEEFIQIHGGLRQGFKGKSATGNIGVSFTDDYRTAKSYADKPAFDNQNSVPMVVERYVELKNPKVIDLKGDKWNLQMGEEISKAIERWV